MEYINPNPANQNPIDQNHVKKAPFIFAFILIILVIIGIYVFLVLSKKPTETSSEKTMSSEIPLTINGYFLAPEIPQKSVVSLMKYDTVFGPDGKMQSIPFGHNKFVAFDPKNGSTTKIFGTDLDIDFHGFFPDRKRLIFEQNLPFKDCFEKEGNKIFIVNKEQIPENRNSVCRFF